MRTAILFSGTAYNFRHSIASIMENMVLPNDADVFILTSRYNMMRRTVSSSDVPLADDANQDLWNSKSRSITRHETQINDSDIAFIRETFGNRLVELQFIEDNPSYMAYLNTERVNMMMGINRYRDECLTIPGAIQPFGGDATQPENGNIKCVVDQYNHVKKCFEIMQHHEGIKGRYDYVVRARLDCIASEKIVFAHYYLNHDYPYLYLCGSVRNDSFEWADEFFWFSKRDTAEKLFPALNRMGFITDRKYNTLAPMQPNDFVFAPETQFSLLLYELEIPLINVHIYRSAKFTNGGDGYDYYNYKLRRDKIDLEYEYELVCKGPSDINEHLPTLRKYAEECDHITELGTRYGNSTVAFMAAKKKLITYDVAHNEKIDYLVKIAQENDLDFRVVIENPQEIEPTDLLFIDTDHHVEQCSIELKLHADKVRKYLIFHDTTYFWEKGQGHQSGGGLRYAIEPFMASHPEWKQKQRFTNNNGLLILERCQ